MQATTDPARFAAAPIGRYLIGPCWTHWCFSGECYGVTLWGRPDRSGTVALVASLASELRPEVHRHVSLVDASRVTGADGGAFEELSAYVESNHQALADRVAKLALVRPRGIAGAVMSGFFEMSEPPYPVSLFDSETDAIGWLDLEKGAELVTELEAMGAATFELPAPLPTLRAAIEERLGDSIDLPTIAETMRMSERSLQRRLKELGSTFQSVVAQVRIAWAKDRMLDSDAPLTAIAVDAGFTSLQHFSNQFRKLVGEPPSVWREKNR